VSSHTGKSLAAAGDRSAESSLTISFDYPGDRFAMHVTGAFA
jgi:hypothetical protein